MANRLADQLSPYLLQHKDNPVDWYPWGPQALARAKEEQKPLLVSIGYAACHWCHVMEHESFQDPAVAAVMNDLFVCVKVDREERPDIDAIYIEAVQSMSGQAGWPLNVFLTPDQIPFYGGTYFPPQSRGGRPSWTQILQGVADAWDQRRDEINEQGILIKQRLEISAQLKAKDQSSQPPSDQLLTEALEQAQHSFDPLDGGFGEAPKFPPGSLIEFLLNSGEQQMSLHTLERMASGGIYDQIGGGFARYSVDAQWDVPHFEKMLYDNALLARCYLHAWQISKQPLFKRVCCETLDWILQQMRGPEGGFYSSIDADSEGSEGTYYVFTAEEIRAALDNTELADEAIRYFGVTAEGNFEGSNTLRRFLPEPQRLDEIKTQLLNYRSKRTLPAVDDKRLTSWNALTITALADAAAVLDRPDYLAAACDCGDFVLSQLRTDTGRLLRSYRAGSAALPAYLEDYAYLLEALIQLHQATFDQRWLLEAKATADLMIKLFKDNQNGGFFSTASDHEQLLIRRKEINDTPIPAGNSSAALGLFKLYALTGHGPYREFATEATALAGPAASRHPQMFGHLLQAIDLQLALDSGSLKQVVVIGPQAELWRSEIAKRFDPKRVLTGATEVTDTPVTELLKQSYSSTKTSVFICENFTCKLPVNELETALKML